MITWDFDTLAELERLGGSIHQDDDPPLDAEGDANEQARVARYLELLDAAGEDDAARTDETVARAILRSLHPIDDYGIYQAAYGALETLDPETLVRALAAELPAWLAERGVHDAIEGAVAPLVWSDGGTDRLVEAARDWDEKQRATVRAAAEKWSRDDEAFDGLLRALGGALPPSGTDPIPEDWPQDWRAAALDFRATGRVSTAWPDERNFASNFDRVLAIMQLGHGSRWRDVPDLLNPLLVRRRKELPAFARALADLPVARRARILAAVERARPAAAAVLREHLEAVQD
ncbi:MAG: hypothetical protein GX593_11990 [Actinomycetales bacterium]|nr:hypothetical protein [Actinomycetales bacterium]